MKLLDSFWREGVQPDGYEILMPKVLLSYTKNLELVVLLLLRLAQTKEEEELVSIRWGCRNACFVVFGIITTKLPTNSSSIGMVEISKELTLFII